MHIIDSFGYVKTQSMNSPWITMVKHAALSTGAPCFVWKHPGTGPGTVVPNGLPRHQQLAAQMAPKIRCRWELSSAWIKSMGQCWFCKPRILKTGWAFLKFDHIHNVLGGYRYSRKRRKHQKANSYFVPVYLVCAYKTWYCISNLYTVCYCILYFRNILHCALMITAIKMSRLFVSQVLHGLGANASGDKRANLARTEVVNIEIICVLHMCCMLFYDF